MMTRLKIFLFCILWAFALSAVGLPAKDSIAEQAEDSGRHLSGALADGLHHYTIPDIVLINNRSEEIRLGDVLDGDGPVLLDFVFTTCPSFCPVMSAIFKQVQKETGNGSDTVRFVSISIDPEHDTPERLDGYAKRFSAGADWQFLTGSIADILSVQKAFDAYRGDKMNHQQLIFVKPANEQGWLRMEGFVEVRELIDAMKLQP